MPASRERNDAWLSDFGSNALVRFDPDTETLVSIPRPILGRPSVRSTVALVGLGCRLGGGQAGDGAHEAGG